MADVHTREQRSRNMAAIRSRGNKSTEIAFLRMLKKKKITGWRRHCRFLRGTPDFVFPKQKVAIFVDGCFWHGCPKCKLRPATNTKFWNEKIMSNRKRDIAVRKKLRKANWIILRFWEHQIRGNPNFVIDKIETVLGKSCPC